MAAAVDGDSATWSVTARGTMDPTGRWLRRGVKDMPYMDTGDMSVSENELWDDVADIGSGW